MNQKNPRHGLSAAVVADLPPEHVVIAPLEMLGRDRDCVFVSDWVIRHLCATLPCDNSQKFLEYLHQCQQQENLPQQPSAPTTATAVA